MNIATLDSVIHSIFDHRKRYFKNGVWEKKSKRAKSDNVQSLLLSCHDMPLLMTYTVINLTYFH